MKYLTLLFLMSCAPNVMHNRILDNNDVAHFYLIDDIHDGSSHWCVKHGIMETIEIKKPSVSSK